MLVMCGREGICTVAAEQHAFVHAVCSFGVMLNTSTLHSHTAQHNGMTWVGGFTSLVRYSQ